MILQGSFAVAAKSEAMIADTLAMSIDAFTYLFNLLAERLKHKSQLIYVFEWCRRGHGHGHGHGRRNDLSSQEIRRRKRELRLYMEFIPHVISVTALVFVSIQAFQDALRTITLEQSQQEHLSSSQNNYNDGDSDGDDQASEPNINLMLLFSALNLGLDIMNVTCFSKVKNFSLSGYGDGSGGGILTIGSEEATASSSNEDCSRCNKNTEDVELGTGTGAGTGASNTETDGLLQKKNGMMIHHDKDVGYGSANYQLPHIISDSLIAKQDDDLSLEDSCIKHLEVADNDDLSEGTENEEKDDLSEISDATSTQTGLNLNMCSAYTHVVADTLRSIAVLIAAGIAFCFKFVKPAIADAYATIVVSFIIALSVGPLLVGLFTTLKEMLEIQKERKMEWKEENEINENAHGESQHLYI